MLERIRRWFRRAPAEGHDSRAGDNVDSMNAAKAAAAQTAGQMSQGTIPPNYVRPVDEGRPKH